MMQRGRKSEASLSVLPTPIGRLPEPPADLTDAQASLWRQIVAGKPADWFGPDSFPLLAAYCRAKFEHDRVSAILNEFDTEWTKDEAGLKRYEALIRVQARLSGSLTSLGTKMRLTQQSRYAPRGAARAAGKGDGLRPWEA